MWCRCPNPSAFKHHDCLLVAHFLYFKVFFHPRLSPICRWFTVLTNRSFLLYGNLSSTCCLLIIVFCILLYMYYSLLSLVNFKRNPFFDLKWKVSLQTMPILSSYFTRSISLPIFLWIAVAAVLLLLDNIVSLLVLVLNKNQP